MKSAYLIAASGEDLERLAEAWSSLHGARMGTDNIQWFDSGFLFNVDTDEDEFQASDWRQGWRESESVDSEPPEGAVSWYIECRSEEVFARIMREASALVAGPLWVLDSNDVVWPAEVIDPTRICL